MALAGILNSASTVFLLLLLLCVSPLCPVGASHNITAILSDNRDFTEFRAAMNSANLTPEIDNDDVMAQIGTLRLPADALGHRPAAGSANPTPTYKNGCLSFDSLVFSDDAAKELYQSSLNGGGLTVFCPADDAVAAFIPTFSNLTSDAKLALLLYHAVATHYSEKALKTINGEVNTLATDGGKGMNLTIKDDGATVKLSSSSGKEARVAKTIQDVDPHAVYLIDAVLIPREVLHVSSGAAAPSPAPITSPAPASVTNPAHSPNRQPAPTPAPASAPAPTPDADNQPHPDQPPKNGASGGMASWSLLAAAAIALVLW